MQPTLLCLGVGAMLLSVAPSTLSFSQGANDASCQEMIPGHIRAQRQYLQHSHIALRTSASSYLPGQLITVTVRSSRDFMGFLVQARSANSAWDGSRARAGVKSRPGAGLKSTRMGPVLGGGSWVLSPPGTHALRCLSEGDTLTHSDKQLKRNLSFVWRAPDTPTGDIRFYITVVQSYFVYWAGIESAVVRDGSRGPRVGSDTTKADGASPNSAMQEASRVRGPSKNKTAGSATTRGPTKTSSSAALAYFGIQNLTNKVVIDRHNLQKLEFLHSVTKDNKTDSTPLSHVTEEAGVNTGRPVTHTQDQNVFLISSNVRSTASLPSADATAMKTTNSTSAPHSQLPSLKLFIPIKHDEMKREDPNIYLKHSNEYTLHPPTTSASVPSTIHYSAGTRPQRDTTHNPRDLHQIRAVESETPGSSETWRSLTKPQISTIKPVLGKQTVAEIPHLRPSLQLQTSSPRMFLKDQPSASKPFLITSTGNSIPVSQASIPKVSSQPKTHLINVNPSLKSSTPPYFLHSHTTTPQRLSMENVFNQHTSSHHQFVRESPRPQPGGSQFELQSQPRETSVDYPQIPTASPPSSPQKQPYSSFPKAMPVTIPTQSLSQETPAHKYQSQSDIPPEALSISYQRQFQPHSQTEAKPEVTSKWNQSQPSVKPSSSGPIHFTPRQVEGLRTGEGSENIKSPTNFPYFSVSTQKSSLLSSSSASTFLVSSLDHGSSTKPPSSLGSTLGSIHPSVGNQLKTAPALLALPSPLPISIPPHFPSAEPSSTSPLPSLASVTAPSSNFSKHVSPTGLFSQVPSSVSYSSSFTSSRHIKGSAFPLPSTSTSSPVIASSSITSSGSSASSTTFPPSHSSFTSTSNQSSSSSPSYSMSFHSSTPHLGPSPAPRRSLYNPSVSSLSPMPLQRLTVGQRLLIHNYMVTSKLDHNPPTTRTVVYPNPLPQPNPNFKQDYGSILKPNTDSKPKHPSIPSKTPDKEGKYPDIVPRHSAWELGMLLGCSAGLGMVLVVGIRYMYRQACGQKTQMTLNDREREYGRGERGLIHVQECGDLVRVRRISENSFVLLAEYDILASPGD